MLHVRFGSKADMTALPRDVRFTPKSGHGLSAIGYPLLHPDRPVPTGQKSSEAVQL